MSQQQAQINALEHLVVALFKELDVRTGIPYTPIVATAKASILGSNGPGGPEQKAEAVQYLEHLETMLKATRR